jgi:excisionase family DNA binding protein
MERFLTFGEVRRLLGVGRSTVWRWQTERGLKVVKVGNVARVRESDLQEFLKQHESGGSAEAAERFNDGT